jgi:hypothetical protein
MGRLAALVGHHPLTADQAAVLKKNLAQIILASACNGERDIEQLKEIALRGVSGRSPTSLHSRSIWTTAEP